MPRSIYCSTCKKVKEPGRENESRCFKCKSDAYKRNRALKREAKGLRPFGSGRNPICRCGTEKENPKLVECYSCKRKRDREWRVKTGRSLKNRTGKCKCGNDYIIGKPGYCRKCRNAQSARWKRENPEYYKKYYLQRKAHAMVLRAIKHGLRRLPCEVCGTTENVEAHHDDYTKPLDVRWLCRNHHREHHNGIQFKGLII